MAIFQSPGMSIAKTRGLFAVQLYYVVISTGENSGVVCITSIAYWFSMEDKRHFDQIFR